MFRETSEKMVKTSNSKYPELEVGISMRISIPNVNRARGSLRNVLAVITNMKDSLYKLCKHNLCNYFKQLNII